MKISSIKRLFLYNGVQFADPGPALSLDKVKDILSAIHGELSTAALEGPVIDGDKHTYTFVRAVRDKGGRAEP